MLYLHLFPPVLPYLTHLFPPQVLFKKGHDDDKTPKLKDFGLDPEYRKYVFAEEYLDNADASTRDQIRRQQREDSRTSRRKFQQEMHPGATDTKIG